MADKTEKVPENIPGKFYVDKTCVPCKTCMEIDGVGEILKYNDDETYVYFYKQPASPAEVTSAEEALAVCPAGSIGDDGDA